AAGECIKVTLYNGLGEGALDDTDAFNVVPMVMERFNLNEVHVSSEVGLHPQLVTYDVATDEGVNAGFNVSHWQKRTVAPGDAPVTYKWYAGEVKVVKNPGGDKPFKLEAIPIEFGATNLVSPDPLEHSAKGLIASLIIEPAGSTWKTDQERCYPFATGKGKNGGVQAPDADCYNAGGEIVYRNSRSAATICDGLCKEDGTNILFREMVLNFQDDVQLRDANGNPVCPIVGADEDATPDANGAFECGGPEDPEDSGNKAVNYKTEPAWFRMGHDPGAPLTHTRQIDFTNLLSNNLLGADLLKNPIGDPETPILTAKAGQEVRFRVLESGGHPRNHVFAVNGHLWQKTPHQNATEDNAGTWGVDESSIGSEWIGDNPNSEHYGTQAGHGPQNHFDMVLQKAGGANGVTGDYLWRNQASFQFDAGHWGLLRVID
ncbi:MAG: hypothetical protein OEZ27_03715, partial [Nitrospinota bacterium]|nr:hypothetical protein [Nitrospinota bacterium]